MSESKTLSPETPDLSTKKAALPTEKTKSFGYQQVHEDVNSGKYIGAYGSWHAPYHALAAVRVGKDLKAFHKKRSPDEFYVESLDQHLQRPETRRRWNDIVTIDPLGMYSTPPTMSATCAKMDIPEIKSRLERDGTIVCEDGSINVVKCAIDYVWNLPALAERLGMDETKMREALADYTQNPKLLDPNNKTYMPPVGGITVYFIGDIDKLHLRTTEVAVRVHDACCGSDVFGTDICTCRPYLIYALHQATECAQRGGVGIIIYYQKEGRSLGEVTKFRVYNARKRQEGGDRPEMYFYQTEQIAGIRDARFQEMMPDVLLWLGIERIDWLLSMSSDKYEGITSMGIDVMQRVALPDMYVPKGATIEITAKISAGYHATQIQSEEIISELRSLETIRAKCREIYDLALADKTKHFKLDLSKLPAVADYVTEVMKKNYPEGKVPYHSRWRHLDQKSVDAVANAWPCDKIEKVRRLVDMVTMSVLLDAGAGASWKYIDEHGHEHTRSEGLAVATFDMFKDGLFSSDVAAPHRVNSLGLRNVTTKQLSQGFEVSSHNPMVGLEGRYGIVHRLADALEASPEFFGRELFRPGNIVDYVLKHAKDNVVSVKVLWKAISEGFESVWPENISGVRRGDVWVYTALKKKSQAASDMVPFHKLSQWLTYSLVEPLESLGLRFTDMHLLTGLAEYRNGGLFVDFDVIVARDPHTYELAFDVGSELVVEWRALTIMLLDEVAELIRKKLNKTADEMPLTCILQGGTWAAGRAIAAVKRPETRSSPIAVRSEGTVF